MRPWAFAAAIALLALTVGSGLLPERAPGAGGPATAFASSGTMRLVPNPKVTAWNGNSVTVDIQAQNVVTTTLCSTNPEDPQAPTAPCGLGAFDFTVTWNPFHFTWNPTVSSVTPGPMLTATGRSLSCFAPITTTSSARFQCVSFGTAPGLPLGPQGTGTLAFLNIDPVPSGCCFIAPLHFSEAKLFDIQGNEFAATPVSGGVQFTVCLDVGTPPDGGVDLADTLAILGQFGQFVPPADPKFDANFDDAIDLTDALWSLSEFGLTCTYP